MTPTYTTPLAAPPFHRGRETYPPFPGDSRNPPASGEHGQRIHADDLRAALAAFAPVWDHLTSHDRARVVQLLIERIDYDGGSGSLKITFAPAGVRTLAAEAGQ
jgi:hypothetical protein